MEDILQFRKIKEENIDQVGLKAYNLSRIREYVNVSNGFVLPKNLMKRFLEENNIVEMIERFLSSLMIDNENIIPIVNLIQKRIINSNFSNEMKEEIIEFYDSLAYSKSQDAGQMLDKKKKTLVSIRNGEWTEKSDNIYQLNVIGDEKLFEAIKLAFASNFTSKKIIEKKEAGKDNSEILTSSINSVIVQLMQQVHRSGISISLNPENNSEKEILIRGAFGLGISKDDPNLQYDEYVINHDYELLSSKIGKQDYAYEKDIDSDITVKYMLKENSTKEKLNQTHLKEIGQATRKLARILESNIILEWGFKKDTLIIFDAKPIEVEKLNHDISEYSEEDETDKNIELEEYDISGQNLISIDIEEENIETLPETVETIDIDDSNEIIDLEEELEKPTLEYEEKVEEVVTLDDFEEEKDVNESEESDFGYNFIDERPNEEYDKEDDLIIDLDTGLEESEEQGPEPDLFINMNRPNLEEASKKISESTEEEIPKPTNDDFAQQLLDEDFEDLDDEEIEFYDAKKDIQEDIIEEDIRIPEKQEEDMPGMKGEEIEFFEIEEDKIEEPFAPIEEPELNIEEKSENEEPSFFDIVEDDSENIFNQQETNQEVEEQPEFIAPIEEASEPVQEKEEESPDFFSRMEVEDDGDFIFSNETKEKDVAIQEPLSEPQTEVSQDSSKVIACDAQILKRLKEKFSELYDYEPSNNMIQLIEQLKDKIEVPYEDEIKRIRMLREKYLADYEDLSNEDINFCNETSKKFTSEF